VIIERVVNSLWAITGEGHMFMCDLSCSANVSHIVQFFFHMLISTNLNFRVAGVGGFFRAIIFTYAIRTVTNPGRFDNISFTHGKESIKIKSKIFLPTCTVTNFQGESKKSSMIWYFCPMKPNTPI
jgi:hypothetical protein